MNAETGLKNFGSDDAIVSDIIGKIKLVINKAKDTI